MQETFSHETLFYADSEEFLEGTVPFVERALEDDEPTLVAIGRAKATMLRGELGRAAGEVRFVDVERLGRNPARIIPFWREFVDERCGSTTPVRGIGEPIWPGRTKPEIDECQRHESLINHAFAGAPAWRLLCPYDSRSLPDEVLEAALECHPRVAGGGTCVANPRWRSGNCPPRPFAGSLAPHPSDAIAFSFDRGTLHQVRRLVGREAERLRLVATRCADVVTASSELAANSIVHGGGGGDLAIWAEADSLLVEVRDGGWIEEPLAGRLRPEPSQISGRGLWIANSLCDLVQIRSGASGTAVRLHMAVDG